MEILTVDKLINAAVAFSKFFLLFGAVHHFSAIFIHIPPRMDTVLPHPCGYDGDMSNLRTDRYKTDDSYAGATNIHAG